MSYSIFKQTIWSLFTACLRRYARQRVRHSFPGSTFIGPYETKGEYIGIWEEQWLWAHRDQIRGVVLDMSTPKYFHQFIYDLPAVEKVLISNLDSPEVTKCGHSSRADIVGDFCTSPSPSGPGLFDTVLCLSVLEHCKDPAALISNIRIALRPGGLALFMSPYAYVDGHMGTLFPDYWRFGRDGYIYLAQRAGLELVETGEFDDLGACFLLRYGWNAKATSWHRGVPVVNWMICRRPQGGPESKGAEC